MVAKAVKAKGLGRNGATGVAMRASATIGEEHKKKNTDAGIKMSG